MAHTADVNLAALIAGFMQAHDRFELARRDRFNFLPAYFALFEALGWSYSIDEWFKEHGQHHLREHNELRGLRYARNCVHHRWYQALWMDLGSELPFVLGQARLGPSEWRWKNELACKRDADLPAYCDHLAGKPARLTLSALRTYLAPMVDSPVSGIARGAQTSGRRKQDHDPTAVADVASFGEDPTDASAE